MAEIDLSDVTLDLNTLTFGDVEDLEETSGMSYDEIEKHVKDGANPPLKLAKALLWVALRQHNPDLTLDDIRSLKLHDLGELNITAGEVPPTGAPA